jgi:hypothetical protein
MFLKQNEIIMALQKIYPQGGYAVTKEGEIEITPDGNIPSEEDLKNAYLEQKAIEEAITQRDNIRSKIIETAGDTETLLGTTANASQMLLFAFSKLITGLNGAKSIAEIKKAAEPFEKMCSDFLDKIEKKEVVLPYALDKLDDVMTEIGERATKVAKVLEEAKG